MAERPFYTDRSAVESGEASVALQFTATTAGAVGTLDRGNRVITSVTKGTTGLYTVLFAQPWVAALGGNGWIKNAAAYSKTAACSVDISTDVGISVDATRTIVLRVTDGDGDLIDLATGDVVKFLFTLQWNNASARAPRS